MGQALLAMHTLWEIRGFLRKTYEGRRGTCSGEKGRQLRPEFSAILQAARRSLISQQMSSGLRSIKRWIGR